VTLAFSIGVAAVFGAGVFLVQQRDLFRVVVGIVLITNAAILFIIAAGLIRGKVPILPLPEGGVEGGVSDPLVQAMALTALIIGSSVAALLLSLAYRLYISQGTVDLSDVSEAEVRDAEALERGEEPTTEEDPEEKPGDEELEVESR
jgi:multicomponent Na+:H+ antiporter subunit C